MDFRKIVKENARDEWEDLKAHWTASRKPKMHDQFEYNREWNKAHPEIKCDRCGFTSRNEDYFGVEGDEVLCGKCRSRRVNESGSTIRKKIDGKTVKGWYEWLKEENMGCCHLSVGQTAKNDICICMGWHDDGDDGEIAWKIGQQSFRNAMQTDLDVDFDMPYDPETGDVYDTLSYLDNVDPETFDWDGLANEMNITAQEVYEYACEVDGTDEDDIYNEGLEEDVLDMPDRVDELEAEIEKLWDELGDIGGKNEIVLDLISKYVELDKIEPGRVDF